MEFATLWREQRLTLGSQCKALCVFQVLEPGLCQTSLAEMRLQPGKHWQGLLSFAMFLRSIVHLFLFHLLQFQYGWAKTLSGEEFVCCLAYLTHHYLYHLYRSLASISQPFLQCYHSYSLRFSALRACFLLPFTSLGLLVTTWAGMMLRFMKFSALSCKEQSVLSYFFFSCSKIQRFPEESAEAGRLGMAVPFQGSRSSRVSNRR